MSRIEEALEKAIQKKQAVGQKRAPVSRPPAASPEPATDFSDVFPLHGPEVASPYLVTIKQPGSPAAEQYRKLKSYVVKQAGQDPIRNSLMVTSAVGGEGKTLASLNLGITLSQEFDHTVLLVDADLRRPSVLNYLGFPSGPGLAECVLDGADVGEVLVKTGLGKLSILPAGKNIKNPTEILSSKRMKDVFEEIRNRYPDRFVIFDTPPLLPFADAHYISRMVDSILFVVRQSYTPFNKIKESICLLENKKIIGFVCNDLEQSSSVNGYYHYYGYKY
jgi:exopolysaccharide/PEP-CTERM locus tyrosine autokinase